MSETKNEELVMNIEAGTTPEEEPQGPYFYYRDHSHLPDPDPTKPVTIPGRIPTFPAKLFAILSRPDLADIISWMPHGRSWKVHKPREFEVKVIPSYFDHAKFSSFIRQANGWGFKRVCTKGADRNSHYHELFLRGMPHLIKFMKRPVSGSSNNSNKVPNQPQHAKGKNCDPDFYKISEEHPLPEFTPKMLHPLDESSFLNSANNRMLGSSGSNFGRPSMNGTNEKPDQQQPQQQQPAFPSLELNTSNSPSEHLSHLQSFFAQQDSFKAQSLNETETAAPSLAQQQQNQAFLLPRQQPQVVTSAPELQQQHEHQDHHCPVRQQEKELDPLTILLNDVYSDACIDDPIIQSLISDPTVPPPSSLQQSQSKPSTPVYEPMYHCSSSSSAPQPYYSMNVVSPVEEKKIVSLPEPAYVNTHNNMFQNMSNGFHEELNFEDPFAGGMLAGDFF